MPKVLATGVRSWQTTLMGVITAVAVILPAVQLLLDGDATTQPDWNIVVPALTAAVGLLLARDGDKTSEEVGAK